MMTGRTLATYLSGASALAIGTAALLMPVDAEANCTAVPGAAANSVTVTCSTGAPDTAPFMTSHPGSISPLVAPSDGSGPDTINITGGNILNTLGLTTPEVGGLGGPALDASPGVIMTLGGADIVNMSGGVIGAPGSPINLDLGDGLNSFTMSGGTLYGSVIGGVDRDVIEVSGASTSIQPFLGGTGIDTGDGDDEVRILGGSLGNVVEAAGIDLGVGADTFIMREGTVSGTISGGDGSDEFTISGGTIGSTAVPADVDLGDGLNTFTMSGGILNGSVFGGVDRDVIEVSGTATITGVSGSAIEAGDGDDEIRVLGGTVGTATASADVYLDNGLNTFTMSGGTLNGSVFGGVDRDVIQVSGASTSIIGSTDSAAIDAGDGDNLIQISGGTISGDPAVETIFMGGGANTVEMSGGTVFGNIVGQGGGNTYEISGGSLQGAIFAGSGNDNVTVSGTAQIAVASGNAIGLDAGDDQFTMTGGTITGNVSGNDGVDTFDISGGTINGNITGDAGVDSVTVSGGTITGGIDAETVTLNGGTIGGDITGLGPDTLTINGSAVPLSLRDGVVFSGTNANGFINNEDLAQGGTLTQVFTGFDNVTADASTLGFGSSAIGIGLLTLQNGSTLFINGTPTMSGTASVVGSTIQMIDGAADDVFTLGGIALDGATIGVDIDQQTLQADQVVTGAFSALGTNTILVNLLGTPQFSQTTEIPVIVSGSPVSGDFQISGLPGTPGSLFTYDLVVGPDGNLYLRATPADFQVAIATQNAIDVATVDTVVNAFYGINNDAIVSDLGLANGTPFAQLTDTLSVFASGQFSHMEHDGFDVSTGGITYGGPGFGVDEYSAAISLDFNAGKAFDLDPQYGLNLGLFGGYAQANVDVGAFQGFSSTGESTNRSGMFGSYGLFRQNYNYLLVSGIAFFGSTDITNDILGTTGDYDTEGYGVTASAGHIFVLGEKLRFDLRGGILGVTFSGGDYTDSGGTQYGKSRISFGALKFEPGIYADYALENGMTISPYARADIQQRFGYNNEASIDGVEMDFEDADFSAAVSGGFNLKMTERSTLSSEIKGKWSADSTTVSGKLGLKVAF